MRLAWGIIAVFVLCSLGIGAQVTTGLHHNGWTWQRAALVGGGMVLLTWIAFFGSLACASRPPARGPRTRRGRRRRRDRAIKDAERLLDHGEIDEADYRTRIAHLKQWDGRS